MVQILLTCTITYSLVKEEECHLIILLKQALLDQESRCSDNVGSEFPERKALRSTRANFGLNLGTS